MADSKSIFVGIFGLGLSIFGQANQNEIAVASGILIILLQIFISLNQTDEEISVLKAQINTKNELNRIWREIDNLKK